MKIEQVCMYMFLSFISKVMKVLSLTSVIFDKSHMGKEAMNYRRWILRKYPPLMVPSIPSLETAEKISDIRLK